MKKILGVGLAVMLVLSLGLMALPVRATAETAEVVKPKVRIVSPTTEQPAYVSPPDFVSVEFTFTTPADWADILADIYIEIYKGATVIGSKSVSYIVAPKATYTLTEAVYITAGAAEGKYDVSVSVSLMPVVVPVDDGVVPLTVKATETDAVIVDTTRPTVTITVSDPLINEADVTATFDVIATFSEPMNTKVTPTITFDPAIIGTLTLTPESGAWTEEDTVYTATYEVWDVNVEVADIDVSVSGAQDLAGNVQDPDPTTAANLFDVDTIAPTLVSIEWTDVDGSTGFSPGDTLLFTFSEAMDTATVTIDTLSANLPLSVGDYGKAVVDWATPPGDETLTVTLGADVDIIGNTTVNPTDAVTDAAGNADATVALGPSISDAISPVLLSIVWWDLDESLTINEPDTLEFIFSEAMDTATVTIDTLSANLPLSVGDYGKATVEWAPGGDVLEVSLGTGANIPITAVVDPADAVTDAAGNPDATVAPGTGIVKGVIVSIDVPATVAPGAAFTADVAITHVPDFDAASYRVTFDATVLELTSIADGTIDGVTIPVVSTYVDPAAPGTVMVVQNVAGSPGVTGEGTLAVLHFTFIGPSGTSSTIDLAAGVLSDKHAEAIEAMWFPSLVRADYVVGDANGDGVVNALDITYIERCVSGDPAFPETPGADANEDGLVNALDITAIEILVGLS